MASQALGCSGIFIVACDWQPPLVFCWLSSSLKTQLLKLNALGAFYFTNCGPFSSY